MERSSIDIAEFDWSRFPMETLLEIQCVALNIGIHRLAIVGGAVRDGFLSNTKQRAGQLTNYRGTEV